MSLSYYLAGGKNVQLTSDLMMLKMSLLYTNFQSKELFHVTFSLRTAYRAGTTHFNDRHWMLSK